MRTWILTAAGAGCLVLSLGIAPSATVAATPTAAEISTIAALARNQAKTPEARVAALWTLYNLGKLDDATLRGLLGDNNPSLRKNALKAISEDPKPATDGLRKEVLARVGDTDPAVRLQSLVALAGFPVRPDLAQAVVAAYPSLEDKWSQSAALGVTAAAPLAFVDAAFDAAVPGALAPFAAELGRHVGLKSNPSLAAAFVRAVAGKAARTDALKQAAIESLAAALKPDAAPAWTEDVHRSFAMLLGSQHTGLQGAVLPLVARWDKAGALTTELRPLVGRLAASLGDTALADDQRAQVAVNLLGVRQFDLQIIPAVGRMLGSGSVALQRRLIEALGATPEPAAGAQIINAYPKLAGELRDPAFAQLVKRADWSLALLAAVQSRQIDLPSLGPAAIHRLRTHPDKAVSERAIAVVDAIRGPEQREKDQLIRQFLGAVHQPGNVTNGKQLYTANCANCHRFKGEGRDLAPDLTGMGAHGEEDLLVHILDPNRIVEPNFVAVSIETKDDLTFDGVVSRENQAAVFLRNATGDFEIRQDNVKSRRSTGLSLMPTGFESLGADGLRDLIGYLCADENRFRILDLRDAFTANSTEGIYVSRESRNESLRFTKFGILKVDSIPFEIVHPTRSATGNNVLVLKGGQGFAKSLPQRVEVKAGGVCAAKLHILGGVGGWAWPWGGDQQKDKPVAKLTLHFADGQTEDMVFRNGVEFADYNGRAEVPGSKEAVEVVRYGQVRWFSRPVARQERIERIAIESFDSAVAPTFVAITAELAAAGADASAVAPRAAAVAAAPATAAIRTLIVGGGTHHDFARWFNLADVATLKATGRATVDYTERVDAILPRLGDLDVLYLSNNQPMTNAALRSALLQFADAGKGLLLVHPALWYNWADWPEYNRALCSGGSRGHDKYGEFDVRVTNTAHPIMQGVPETFRLADELYWFEPDAAGPGIEVLATAHSPQKNKTYPMVFTVRHPKARIACITLGHDGQAHSHPGYQKLLHNSLIWAARR
jgi:putative heme-binding domain-containing protein